MARIEPGPKAFVPGAGSTLAEQLQQQTVSTVEGATGASLGELFEYQ